MREVKTATAEELLSAGGYFYEIDGAAWCDLPTSSWKLEPGVGYVRQEDEADPEEGGE